MSEPAVYSVETFANALSVVIAHYLQHLEPSAQTTIHGVRLEANGPHLSIIYEQHGDAPSNLQVSMTNLPKPEQQIRAERGELKDHKRGLFG